MKAIILILCLSAFNMALPVGADECCEGKGVAVEQRIREIDLNIALKQYEQIQTERAKTELQLVLMDTEPGGSEERSKQATALQKRFEILQQHADKIRARLLEMGKALSVASN